MLTLSFFLCLFLIITEQRSFPIRIEGVTERTTDFLLWNPLFLWVCKKGSASLLTWQFSPNQFPWINPKPSTPALASWGTENLKHRKLLVICWLWLWWSQLPFLMSFPSLLVYWSTWQPFALILCFSSKRWWMIHDLKPIALFFCPIVDFPLQESKQV